MTNHARGRSVSIRIERTSGSSSFISLAAIVNQWRTRRKACLALAAMLICVPLVLATSNPSGALPRPAAGQHVVLGRNWRHRQHRPTTTTTLPRKSTTTTAPVSDSPVATTTTPRSTTTTTPRPTTTTTLVIYSPIVTTTTTISSGPVTTPVTPSSVRIASEKNVPSV